MAPRGQSVYRVQNCRSCSARIIWAVTDPELKSGRSTPVDADPHPKGNIMLARDPRIPHEPDAPVVVRATVLRVAQAEGARQAGEVLYRSHFATCPNADQWRKGNAARHAKKETRR